MSIRISANLFHFRRASNVRLSLATAALLFLSPMANAQTVVPTDPSPTCVVSPTEFSSWFASTPVTANGIVNPADSILFPNVPNCSFYKWSEQMFLWLTSPAPSKYGPGAHVFDSPVFYDVSPTDQTTGKRTLVPIVPGRVRDLSSHISQLGPQHLPVVFDRTGKMFTVIQPQVGPEGKTLIQNKAGQSVEVARTQVANGKPVFLDKANKPIDFKVTRNGSPLILDRAGKQIDFRPTVKIINGRSFFQTATGTLIDTEQGQADGNALMAQNGSLIYYALQINDVYAYFLTGQKNSSISATKFPITPSDLIAINQFAANNNKFFPDANALAIELKSSWIEASTLPPGELSKYVTMNATVPQYTQTSPTLWTANGTKQALLALTGIHVVGSANGHAEMIWATFEHINNTRNSTYTYNNNATTTVTVTVPQEPAGTWLFSANTATTTPNQSLVAVSGANLVATSTTPIGPSDILRINPWGKPGNSTASNTEVISINHSVLSQLIPGDVRQNYIMIGATWTAFGQNPPPGPGIPVGTNQMANSTMETYQQPSNCFDCHTGNNMLGTMTGGLSHIYGPLTPLFP